jgi:flavin-dependent dehydrogenase
VGDALGFIDPIYSTGLLLTMLSAERAAVAIDRGLRDGGNPSFEGYSADYTQAFDRFLTLVRAYYTEGFHFGPLARDGEARQGLVDLLIGDVDTPAARGVTRAIHDLMPAC